MEVLTFDMSLTQLTVFFYLRLLLDEEILEHHFWVFVKSWIEYSSLRSLVNWNLIFKLKNFINFCNYAERKNRAYCIFSNVAKLVLCELLLTFWSNLVGSCSPWRSWSRSAAFQFSTALHEPLHFTIANFDKYYPKIEIWKIVCMFVCFIWGLGSLAVSHTYMEVCAVILLDHVHLEDHDLDQQLFSFQRHCTSPCTLSWLILINIIQKFWKQSNQLNVQIEY